MSKVLNLFVWQPARNVFSFCQRLAGTICGHAATKSVYEKVSDTIPPSLKSEIESVLQKAGLNSCDDIYAYQYALQADGITVTDPVLEYCKKYLRFQEKQTFLQHLTGDTPSVFLDFMGDVMPHLLNEMRQV